MAFSSILAYFVMSKSVNMTAFLFTLTSSQIIAFILNIICIFCFYAYQSRPNSFKCNSNTLKSSIKAQASITLSYFLLLNCLPNRMLSLMVACCIHGSCVATAKPSSRSLTLIWPLTLCISANMQLSNELFPDPTLPITPTNWPWLKYKVFYLLEELQYAYM